MEVSDTIYLTRAEVVELYAKGYLIKVIREATLEEKEKRIGPPIEVIMIRDRFVEETQN